MIDGDTELLACEITCQFEGYWTLNPYFELLYSENDCDDGDDDIFPDDCRIRPEFCVGSGRLRVCAFVT